MNYSKQIRRNLIGKRLILSWLLIATVCLMSGIGIGYAFRAHISASEVYAADRADKSVFAVYGAYDNNPCAEEICTDWQAAPDFVPLDVPLEQDLQEFIFCLCDIKS